MSNTAAAPAAPAANAAPAENAAASKNGAENAAKVIEKTISEDVIVKAIENDMEKKNAIKLSIALYFGKKLILEQEKLQVLQTVNKTEEGKAEQEPSADTKVSDKIKEIEEGLKTILDNVEAKGVDKTKNLEILEDNLRVIFNDIEIKNKEEDITKLKGLFDTACAALPEAAPAAAPAEPVAAGATAGGGRRRTHRKKSKKSKKSRRRRSKVPKSA
jgi:hypothetical protein